MCFELTWVGGERWGFEGWGFERWGAEGWGAQNFALFFPSPAAKFVLSFPLWGSFRGILVVFLKTGTLKCARLEFSGCRVRAPAARSGGAAGVSHDSPRNLYFGQSQFAKIGFDPPEHLNTNTCTPEPEVNERA